MTAAAYDWIAYWVERFRPRVFVPAALVVATAAQAGTGLEPRASLVNFCSALLLLAQFRLWDDLADRDRDRVTHPSRVLVRATQPTIFVVAGTFLALANLAVAGWTRGAAGAVGLLAIDLAAAAWYTWRPARRSAATDLVLLTKYPLFVLLLALGSPSILPVALSAGTVYLLTCAFEIWHDASGPLRMSS